VKPRRRGHRERGPSGGGLKGRLKYVTKNQSDWEVSMASTAPIITLSPEANERKLGISKEGVNMGLRVW